jgi:hypothetical protein
MIQPGILKPEVISYHMFQGYINCQILVGPIFVTTGLAEDLVPTREKRLVLKGAIIYDNLPYSMALLLKL